MDQAGLIDRHPPSGGEGSNCQPADSDGPAAETGVESSAPTDSAESPIEAESVNGENENGREPSKTSSDIPSQTGSARELGSLPGGVPNGGSDGDGSTVNTPPGRVFIEFGAGRGYLANALYECFGQPDLLFVERRAYKFKADRALRKVGKMERIRIDIEDLDLAGVESLRGREFVGAGKHLCGPATDATLRCCLGSGNGNESRNGSRNGNGTSSGIGDERTIENGGDENGSKGRDSKSGSGERTRRNQANGHCADVSNDATGREQAASLPAASPDLRSGLDASREAPFCSGVAVATCCHHLCSWRTYVNKAFFRRLGFSPAEFHMLTWLTSWCVSGPKFGEHRGPDAGSLDELKSPGESPENVSDRLTGKLIPPNSAAAVSRSETIEKAEAGSEEGRKEGSFASDIASNSLEVNGASNGSVAPQTPIWDALSPSQRIELGQKCKRLIDTGRLEWLAEHKGFAAELIEYVDEEVSPENRLLVATRTRKLS